MVSSSRRYFRKQRNSLSYQKQHNNAVRLSKHIQRFLSLKKTKSIAIYLPSDGELSPLLLFQSLRKKNIKFYLPILSKLSFQGLRFGQYNDQTIFKPNKFNINEPVLHPRQLNKASELDVIFLPLVAYDLKGNRMGMGGGFYDRALQIRQRRKHWKKPLLIGLAHSIQRSERIENNHWDVPLDGIATELGIHLF